MSDGYWWFPGNARHDRGYTREEALAAVGAGWAPLVERAWAAVKEASGEIMQVKEKFGALTVYADTPPDRSGEMHATLDRLADESACTCQWCGTTGEGSSCDACRKRRAWKRLDLESHQQWIPGESGEDRHE